MPIRLKLTDPNTFSGWRNLTSLKLKTGEPNTFNAWKNITKAFLKTDAGWKLVFGIGLEGPTINQDPVISAGNWSVISNVGRFVLTGVNGTWSYAPGGTITQTYEFQYSTDGNNWSFLDGGSISNGQSKTFTVFQSNFPAASVYYRFSVTAVANINNSFTTKNSTSVYVSMPSPTALSGGYVTALSNASGSISPGVPTISSSGGINEFTLSWSNLTNTTSAVVTWSPADTTPAPPQTYYTTSGSITPTKIVQSQQSVSASITLYGTAGTGGGTFSAGWSTSAYANVYNISYSINGGTTQNTTSTGNLINLGTGNPGDSITVTITPYNTNTGLSGSSFTSSATIPTPTVPEITYAFDDVAINPSTTLIPFTNGVTQTAANGGITADSNGTITVRQISAQNIGTWSNSPTQYRYVWQRVAINGNPVAGEPTFTRITTSTSDSYTPGSPTNNTYAVTIHAYNIYGISTTSYQPSYEFFESVSLPLNGTVTLTGSGASGTNLVATTSGWSNNPTSYVVGIWAGYAPGPYNILKATNSPSTSNTATYTITTSDATTPAYTFIARASANNIYGSGNTVAESNTITSYIAATPVPAPVAPTPVAPVAPQPVPVTPVATVTYYIGTSTCDRETGQYVDGPSVSGPYTGSSLPADTVVTNFRTTVVTVYRTSSAAALSAAAQAACTTVPAPAPAPVAPTPTPTPTPTPQAPVPVPVAPVPQPTPQPTPQAPVPQPIPVPVPVAPVPQPTPQPAPRAPIPQPIPVPVPIAIPTPQPTAPAPAPQPVIRTGRICTTFNSERFGCAVGVECASVFSGATCSF